MFPLLSVKIENFRGIRDLDLLLDPRATVLFGRNAVGKTTVIDALCIGLGAIGTRMPGSTGRDFDLGDLRRPRRATPSEKPGVVAQYASVTMRGAGDVEWQLAKVRDKTIRLPKPFLGRAKLHDWLDPKITAIQNKDHDAGVALPVVAAYGPERAVVEIPLRERDFGKDFPRLAGLNGSLKATTRFKSVFEWFRLMEDEERRERERRKDFDYRLPALEWVRRAITAALPACRNPRTLNKPIRLVVDFVRDDGGIEELDIKELSDGYRTHFALVADLARRTVQVNPTDDLASTTHGTQSAGVVLIDEIDLHLHPSWQTTVLPSLLTTFPHIQFIVTTHSEQVISSVKKEQVFALEDAGGQVQAVGVPFAQGASGERVLSLLMGVEDRVPGEVTTLLREYLKLVEGGRGEAPEARALRVRLDGELPGDPLLIDADSEIERAKILTRLGGLT